MIPRSGQATLGIGTATFIPGYGLDPSASLPGADLLRAAIERGITYFDTAAAYGDGERVIGSLAPMVADCGVRVCTKIAVDSGKVTDASFEAAVRASLDRLQCATVDTLLLHSAGSATIQAPAAARACRAIKSAGLVRRVGVSTYGAIDAAAALDADWCDVVQVEYSILNASVVRHIVARRRTGQELVARSILCKGLLTPRWQESPAVARGLEPTLEALAQTSADWGMPLNELAVRFALDTPGLDVVLIGVASREELESACRAAGREALTGDRMATLGAFDRSADDAAHPERWKHVSKT